MEKEKQIEDLAELIDELNRDVIIGYKPMKNGMIADIVKGRTAEEKAEALMEAGYGNVKEAVKELAEWVKKRIEIDKYTPEITKDYDEEEKNNCKFFSLGLNHAQIIIDFFVKEVCGEND